MKKPFAGSGMMTGDAQDIEFLAGRYPTLSREIIAAVASSHGPRRSRIEAELWRLATLESDCR
jgi:hypothetical protein